MHYSRRMGNPRSRLAWAFGWLGIVFSIACSGAHSNGSEEAAWPPDAKKWFERAEASFGSLEIADAELSIKNALELEPQRAAVKLLAASIALSQMRYDEALGHLEGQTSPEAGGLRARALWYSGQLRRAADELDRLLEDPDVKDPWAQGVAQLARGSEGREPFRVSGALLAVVEMPRVPVPSLIVPLELNGEPVLGMVATGTPEVVIDSGQQTPSWVSLRFGRRLDVRDVPALSRDLSSLSRRVGAPIKLLLGVNLLRRLNVTFDFYASQFVVRSFAPPPPPSATPIELSYIKGGGMVMRGRFGTEDAAAGGSFLVDTGVLFPLAMSDSGWKKAGVDPKGFEPVAGEASLKQGLVPRLVLGTFDLPRIPAVYGLPLADLEQGGGIQVDGVIGSALVAEFRASLVDQGRTLWLEEMPVAQNGSGGAAAPDEAPPADEPPSSGTSPAAAPGEKPTSKSSDVPLSSRQPEKGL
jgi:hypothetical protein